MAVIIVQLTVPAYRRALFQRMASALGSGFTVYTSRLDALSTIEVDHRNTPWIRDLGAVRHILPGLQWQVGALSIDLKKGDTLVISGAPRTISTLALMIKAKLRRVAVVWWGHYWSSTSRPWRARIRLALMSLSDAVVFYTDKEVLEYKSRRGSVTKKHIIGLNNGIDTGRILTLRSAYEPALRSRSLFFIGRLNPKAKLDLLLNSMSEPQCEGVTLEVVGNGPASSELRRLADDLGLGGRVRWHGAITDEEKIAAIANGCRIFVYPGSVGLSLIHGLSYGLPAVVHGDRWSHGPEFAAFQHGWNGMSFMRADTASLASTINALIDDLHKLRRLSANAITTTSRSFNAADMATRFVELLTGKGQMD